jgi:peptide/nickel transport system substrate-binding protein
MPAPSPEQYHRATPHGRLQRALSRRPPRVALTVPALVAAIALAGCGSSSSTSSSSSSVSLTASTAAPTGSVSHLSWDLPGGEPSSLDPIQSAEFPEDTVISNLCEGLYRTNPVTFRPEPDLATGMQQVNPLTLVYTIRQDVKFWDGDPLTAADVAYSLERNTITKLASVFSSFYANVKSITATGPYQVTVKLSKPDALFPEEMANIASDVGEASYVKREGAKYGTPSGGIMCSGPFRFVSWTPGQSITIAKNPQYWDTRLIPKVSTITFSFVTETSALTDGLLSGTFDGAYEIPASAIPALQSTGAGHLYIGNGPEYSVIVPFNGALRNAKVREALSLAINRSAIASAVYHGAARPLKAIAGPDAWGFDRSVFQSAYESLPGDAPEIAKAKQLVAEAGAPKEPITLAVASGDQSQIEQSSVIESTASQIGLNVKIRSLAPTQYGNLLYSSAARQGLSAALFLGFFDVQDPLDELIFFVLPAPIGYDNIIEYNDPDVNSLMAKSQESSNTSQRAQYFVEAQKLFQARDTVDIPVVNYFEISFVRHGLTGQPTQFPYFFYPWAATIGSS